jgi:RecA/RadA recombinase
MSGSIQQQDPLVRAYLSSNGHGSEGAFAPRFSTIERERVRWLCPGRVPLGMLAMIFGDPGLGKSLLTCEMAAGVSRAGASVLLLTAEDSPSATVRPRLEAARADLDRVHLVVLRRDGVEEGIALPDDVGELDGLVAGTGARLVVIDPLMAHLPSEVNSWRDQSVRRALAPLYRLARERGCAVVVIAHMNKTKGADPLHRVGGSIGIPGAVRSALLLARDPDDPDGERGRRRVLAHVKSNVSPLAASLSYEIDPILLPGEDQIETARLRLLGESDHSGHDLLDAPRGEERSALDEAVDFLEAELAEGEQEARQVQSAARAAGISDMTLKRARRQLGVESGRVGEGGRRGGGHWVWRLPLKGVSVKGVSPISELDPLNPNPHCSAENEASKALRGSSERYDPLYPATTEEEAELQRLRVKFDGGDDLDDLGAERQLADPLADADRASACQCDYSVPYRGEDRVWCAKCGRAAP